MLTLKFSSIILMFAHLIRFLERGLVKNFSSGNSNLEYGATTVNRQIVAAVVFTESRFLRDGIVNAMSNF